MTGAAPVARIAGFMATLRVNGFPAGVSESLDAVRIAQALGLQSGEALRWGWRALLSGRADEWRRYDDIHDSYWRAPNRTSMVESGAGGAGKMEFDGSDFAAGGKAGPKLQTAPDPAEEQEGKGQSCAPEGASRADADENADFRSLTDKEQTRDIEAAIRKFAGRLKKLQLRREQADLRHGRVDLRRTFRRSIGSGNWGDLAFTSPRRVEPRLVFLIDVSRSMSNYGFFHLRVARALTLAGLDADIFLYHTRLTRISQALEDADPWRAQERLQLLSSGWAGGTRIGECLSEFNRAYARQRVHRRTAVLIASDGFDTGEPGVLGREMAEIARRAKIVAWLNPLAADPAYRPVSRGMREALPHISVLAACHNLRQLGAALCKILEAL